MKSSVAPQIIALHGFLGLPSDWALFKQKQFKAIDVFNFHSELNLWRWGAALNQQVESLSKHQSILIGYSLGGRLGLHALIQNPSLWQGAIIISAHPGLTSESEKQSRLEKDAAWANRFRKELWPSLMADWNRREVFAKDTFSFNRQESHYKREHLAQALENWSLGHQDNLLSAVQQLPLPILWIAGEGDVKYKALAQSLTFQHPQSKVWLAPQAGHRVPWQQPALFTQQLSAFIDSL